MLRQKWSPSSSIPTIPSDSSNRLQNRKFLRWSRLFISATIPLILITFALLFYFQQDSKRKSQWHVDSSTVPMGNALKDLVHDPSLTSIRGKIFLLLRRLNAKEKEDLILFLYHSNLLRDDQLDLTGADFRSVTLTCPHELVHMSLRGIRWLSGSFHNCRFVSSRFDRVDFSQSQFFNCSFDRSSLIETNLRQTSFQHSIIFKTIFNGSSLVEANFLARTRLQDNEFVNVDFNQAKFSDGQRWFMMNNQFHQVRFANGSFQIDQRERNLLINGDADLECFQSKQTIWNSNGTLSTVINEESSFWSNCSFVVNSSAKVWQMVFLSSSSLLIDSNEGFVSLTGFANCNSSYFQLTFSRSNGFVEDFERFDKANDISTSYENISMFSYGQRRLHLPVGTREIVVEFGIDQLNLLSKCFFDNLTLILQ